MDTNVTAFGPFHDPLREQVQGTIKELIYDHTAYHIELASIHDLALPWNYRRRLWTQFRRDNPAIIVTEGRFIDTFLDVHGLYSEKGRQILLQR